MTTRAWTLATALALLAWTGPGLAQAQGILPVDPSTKLPIAGSAVTLSIFKDGVNVTATWTPKPGESVQLVVNGLGASPPDPVLLFDAATAGNPTGNNALTTSAYPGQCTNYNPLGVDPNIPDFALAGTTLTSTDCGGMAVIQVGTGTHYFVVPQDSDFDGMADIREQRYCTGGVECLSRTEDNDTGPVSPSSVGDGLAAFDEIRGFMVSGPDGTPTPIQTDPRQRNLFVHLVNPQCHGSADPAASTLLGPAAGATLFNALKTLISDTQVHLLGHTPGGVHTTTDLWVDRFERYTVQALPTETLGSVSGFLYRDAAGAETRVQPFEDRQINRYAVYPLGAPHPDDAAQLIQKGIRFVECVDASVISPLGVAGLEGLNGRVNSVLFTQRIADYMNGLIDDGGTRQLRLFAFEGGAWVLRYESTGAPTEADRAVVIGATNEYIAAMEGGHNAQLTPEAEGTRRVSYGFHHAPFTGSNEDQTLTQKIDKKASGFNSFYIPRFYNAGDQEAFKLKQ